MFRYRIHDNDGTDLEIDAGYAVLIQPGDKIHLADGRRVEVFDVVPINDEASQYHGLLRVAVGAS